MRRVYWSDANSVLVSDIPSEAPASRKLGCLVFPRITPDGSERTTMRLGIGSYAMAWSIGVPGHAPPRPMTAFNLLNLADELEVRVVQICDNLPLDRLSDQWLDRLAGQAKDCGIQLEVGTRGIRPDHLARYLAIAGAHAFTHPPGRCRYGRSLPFARRDHCRRASDAS